MNENPPPLKLLPWIKNNAIFILILIAFLVFVFNKMDSFESEIYKATTPENTLLDFQNKSGVTRIKSSFTDLLVGSGGSKKKGNGYVLFLKVVNPSSIRLSNIRYSFQHSSSTKAATCNKINLKLSPGSSKTLQCFVSDLADSDLKSIWVEVHFDYMYSR